MARASRSRALILSTKGKRKPSFLPSFLLHGWHFACVLRDILYMCAHHDSPPLPPILFSILVRASIGRELVRLVSFPSCPTFPPFHPGRGHFKSYTLLEFERGEKTTIGPQRNFIVFSDTGVEDFEILTDFRSIELSRVGQIDSIAIKFDRSGIRRQESDKPS